MNRHEVTVKVVINAKSQAEAQTRVEKALVCLENSLAYADPNIFTMEAKS